MSNSDDDKPKPGTSSPPRADDQRRLTMLGMGFSPRPQAPAAGVGDESTDAEGAEGELRAQLDPDAEFVNESTQLGEHFGLALIEDDDMDVRGALDAAWDAAFPEESTLAHPPSRPAASTSDGGSLPDVWDQSIDEISLAEESLPEAIREPNPTLDDFAVVPDADITGPSTSVSLPYIGDNQVVTDFEAQQTALLDSPFESDPTVGKLVALEGPATGQEFFASAMRNTVGRGTNNTIVVPDLAMSRQHFEITRNPDDTFTLYDLQSANGTALNGTRVQESDLLHGDRVEAGESVFQFVVTGSAGVGPRNRRLVPAAVSTLPPVPGAAAPAPTRGMNRAVVTVSVLAVVLSVALIATLALLKLRKEPAATAAVVVTPSDAAATYLLGVEAVKARNWDQAQAQFERARSLDPTLDGVTGQLERIEIERRAMVALEKGRELLDRKLHDEAVARLDEIPLDSVYYAEARDLARGARKASIVALYAEAQTAFGEQEYRRAQRLAQEILTRVPEHRGAVALQERLAGVDLDAGYAEAEPDMGEVAAPAEVAAVSARPRAKRPKGEDGWFDIELVEADEPKPASKASDGGSLTRGFLLYKTRKFQPAQEFFEEVAAGDGPNAARAKKMAAAVKDFRAHYPPGMAAFKVKKWSDARKHLVSAKRADAIVGNHFDADIRQMLATSEANLGLAQLDKGDGVNARKHLDKARAYGPKEPDVTKLERALDLHAKKLYIKAQALRKANPTKAASLCREILAAVPASNETHRKAQELLASLPAR